MPSLATPKPKPISFFRKLMYFGVLVIALLVHYNLKKLPHDKPKYLASMSSIQPSINSFQPIRELSSNINEAFPDQVKIQDKLTGNDVMWSNISADNNQNPLLTPDHLLIRPSDGVALVYASAGPPTDKISSASSGGETANIQNNLSAKVQSSISSSYYSLFYQNDQNRYLIPLNFNHNFTNRFDLPFSASQASSLYDTVANKYLLFFSDVNFHSDPWDNYETWSHFDAWWLDLKNKEITHMVLPAGPWEIDAGSDDDQGRALSNFSCGVDCYRQYKLSVNDGNIFVSISAKPSALNQSSIGTYELRPNDKSWIKTSDKPS